MANNADRKVTGRRSDKTSITRSATVVVYRIIEAIHSTVPEELWPEVLRKIDGDDQTQSGGSGRNTFAPEDDCYVADDFDGLDE